MFISNKLVSVIFKLIIIIICSIGLYRTSGMANAEKKKKDIKNISVLIIYFTNLSNLLCLIYFFTSSIFMVFDIINHGVTGSAAVLFPQFKGAVVLCLLITLLVYNFLLVPQRKKEPSNDSNVSFDFTDICVHYIVPILSFSDWVLFDEKNVYTLFSPFLWIIIPLLYFVFILIRAKFGDNLKAANSKYPYFFIDVDKIGIKRVLINTAILCVIFVILGYLILFFGYLLRVIK